MVDNQSTDQTPHIALEFGCKVVTEEIHQIATVRNTGAKVARGRYLIFVDADTLVPVATFSSAIHAMNSGEVGCGGACLSLITITPAGFRKVPALSLEFYIRKIEAFYEVLFFVRQICFSHVEGFLRPTLQGRKLCFPRN